MKTLSVLGAIIICSCLARTIVKKHPTEAHQKQTKTIYQNIGSLAKSGDWLVTRGYHAFDNIVANATGTPISHAAVFDKEEMLVIEADKTGIHKTQILDFIDKSNRVLIIRPRWQNELNGQLALKNAHNLVGKDYDFTGIIGLNIDEKYYCSELVVHIYKEWHHQKEKLPKVIKPGELYLFGRILYDSLPRDEM